MMHAILSGSYAVVCAAIFWSSFCRIHHATPETKRAVRSAIKCSAFASAAGVFAVLFWDYEPDIFCLLLAIAFAAMLIATSPQWRDGVPAEYLEPKP